MMLQGCGIDSEKISRFETIARESGYPLPFVFSRAEMDHCRRLTNPAVGLCAAFCCKEALRKAIASPYNFTDCEALFDEQGRTVSLRLTESLRRQAGVGDIRAEVMHNPHESGELIVVVSVCTPMQSETNHL
jgi:phosphopantetheinyl transferase (holo-ACP synthase)